MNSTRRSYPPHSDRAGARPRPAPASHHTSAPHTGSTDRPSLTRAHRCLIATVVAGAVITAAIGFAGSYAAVRELAVKKGFGAFSYVFPIGIDAGICVLLALDLLLTWARIPFPLLRQTAWLLTSATIAFNGAAAWPDPLGVGMHAVIPILFVVSVEAARHAIGRIADITADKHMESVRLTRWLLSPVPTFLLWRRMKLWELRSYDQVIKLEQERLLYQTRLRSRYGRAWRRKAPVESLMPLRLARYGVPLTETAPAGLAAAGITEQPKIPTIERTSAPTQPEDFIPDTTATTECDKTQREKTDSLPGLVTTDASKQSTESRESAQEADEQFTETYQALLTQFQSAPTVRQRTSQLRNPCTPSDGAEKSLPKNQKQPLLPVPQQRYAPRAEDSTAPHFENKQPQTANQSPYDYLFSVWRTHHQEHDVFPNADLADRLLERNTASNGQRTTDGNLSGFMTPLQKHTSGNATEFTEEAAANSGTQNKKKTREQETETGPPLTSTEAQTTKEEHDSSVSASLDNPPPRLKKAPGKHVALTTVDRYYLAWMEYQTEHGREPTDEQLSTHLAEKGMHGRGGKPVSPATLRRYFLTFRAYNVWTEHRPKDEQPAANTVAQECTTRGITGQYNKPLTAHYIIENTADFERRWQALNRY
ncbi:DUF2637 domain-containing protein [Streptomyces sp. G35A]